MKALFFLALMATSSVFAMMEEAPMSTYQSKSISSHKDQIAQLPDLAWNHVFNFMSFKDLLKIRSCNKEINKMALTHMNYISNNAGGHQKLYAESIVKVPENKISIDFMKKIFQITTICITDKNLNLFFDMVEQYSLDTISLKLKDTEVQNDWQSSSLVTMFLNKNPLNFFKSLTELSFRGNQGDQNGFEMLSYLFEKDFKNISRLNLSGNNINFAEIPIFKSVQENSFTKLKELLLSQNRMEYLGIDALSSIIEKNFIKELSSLDLGATSIGDIEMKRLSEAFQSGNVRKLTQLYLYSNEITEKGTSWLKKAFKSIPDLKLLNLSDNFIADNGVKIISEGIKETPLFLTVLDLSCSQIGGYFGFPEYMKKFVSTLNSGALKELTSLCLGGNRLGDLGTAIDIFYGKIKPGVLNKLKILDLSQNGISNMRMSLFFKNFPKEYFEKLEQLELSGNNLHPDYAFEKETPYFLQNASEDNGSYSGVQQLARLIEGGHLRNLTFLGIGDTKIDDTEIEVLNQSICKGDLRNLQTLILSDNFIGDTGIQNLKEVIQKGHLPMLSKLEIGNQNETVND